MSNTLEVAIILMTKDVALDAIIIESRGREDFGDLDTLADSIKETGLIHPIVLDRNMRLISGYRRFKAHQILKRATIRAEILDLDITNEKGALIGRLIELQENVIRKDMTWDETSRLRVEIHEMRIKLHGAKVHNRDPEGWSAAMTATLVGVAPATISIDKQLVEAMKEYPALAKCESRETAIKKLSKIKEHKLLSELARRRAKKAAEAFRVYCGDCQELIKTIPDESVDCIIFDPPWGINSDKQARTEDSYDDNPQRALTLQLKMFPELYRVMKPGTVMWFFFGIEHYSFLIVQLESAGFKVRQVPCVWIKPNPALGDENRFGTQYETFLFISKGEPRYFTKPRGDVFAFSRVASGKAIAAAEKPVELIIELIELVSVKNEIVLDPTMGSGASIEAALKCSRRAIGFEKSEDLMAKIQFRLDKYDPTKTSTESFVEEIMAEETDVEDEEEEFEDNPEDLDEDLDAEEIDKFEKEE